MTVTYNVLQQLRGEYLFMQDYDIKPNFSALARKYGLDRHTVAKYYKNGMTIKTTKQRPSKFDQYHEEIEQKIQNAPSTTKKAMYEFFRRKYPDTFTSYSSFKYYVNKHKFFDLEKEDPKVRFETDPGEFMQVDWKEDMKMTLKNGEVVTFNVFGATLSYSRYHIFIYSKGKGQKDFMRCLVQAMQMLGGKTQNVLTDNMAAICNHSTGKLLPSIIEFGKDIGVHIKRCKVRHAYTKGKVESANRFLEWLVPYNNELNSEEEIIETLKAVQLRSNEEVNQTTGIPPMILVKKELNHLAQLPSESLMNQYIEETFKQKVPSTLLVRYKGAEYSVPPEFIGKTISYQEINNELYIYDNTKVIAIHHLQKKCSINYLPDHYEQGIKGKLSKKFSDEDIKEIALKNVLDLAKIGDYHE